MFIDTHTHLYSEEFKTDGLDCIENALSQSVSKFYMPNIDLESIAPMLEVEAKYPNNCFAMMGLHPCYVKETYKQDLDVIKQWLDKRKFAAIGEIGMDLYWDKNYITEQKDCFKQQVEWALHYNYAIVIHCRSAFDEIYSVLKSFKTLPKGIFHCFSGSYEQAQSILRLGDFKLGIGGVVTFKNAGLVSAIEKLNLSDLVLETDAPYLAPAPYRGKRNESAYIPIIAQKIADIKLVSLEEVAEITTKNALAIFEN